MRIQIIPARTARRRRRRRRFNVGRVLVLNKPPASSFFIKETAPASTPAWARAWHTLLAVL